MKTIHKFSEEIENLLINLSDDELTIWFETNTIEYDNPNLLEVICGNKTTNTED